MPFTVLDVYACLSDDELSRIGTSTDSHDELIIIDDVFAHRFGL